MKSIRLQSTDNKSWIIFVEHIASIVLDDKTGNSILQLSSGQAITTDLKNQELLDHINKAK